MTPQAPCSYVEELCRIAQHAGRKILDIYEAGFKVDKKEDGSPLTQADRASHEVIVQSLAKLTPELPILSEEAIETPFEKRREWKRFWLVDPLDGTKEFINRNNEFTVNIALVDGVRPVLGVVYVPALALTYYGCLGEGSYKQKMGERPKRISVRDYAGGKPIVAASRSHGGEALAAYLARLGEHDLVSLGSSLKFCLVAEGTADFYPRLGPTMEWDTAAAQAIVEAAGGQVVDIDDKVLRYNKPSLRNPFFFAKGSGERDWLSYLTRESA